MMRSSSNSTYWERISGSSTTCHPRAPMIAVFFFDGDRIINERIYFDTASLVPQIGRGELLTLAGNADD